MIAMSPWTHALCQRCWDELNPNRRPAEVADARKETCCSCELPTRSGIYVRREPKTLRCGGKHDGEPS